VKYSVRNTKKFRKDFEKLKSQDKELQKLHDVIKEFS